jgi:hypothetical protein
MYAVALLEKYFYQSRTSFEIVLEHSRLVAEKALMVARLQNNPESIWSLSRKALSMISEFQAYAPRSAVMAFSHTSAMVCWDGKSWKQKAFRLMR